MVSGEVWGASRPKQISFPLFSLMLFGKLGVVSGDVIFIVVVFGGGAGVPCYPRGEILDSLRLA